MKTEDGLLDYSKYFNESGLFIKLGKVVGLLGQKTLYSVLILYYLMFDKNVPFKVRTVFMASLGYFILPTDLVADFLPVIGFADDIALISYIIANAIEYITPEINEKVAAKTRELIRKYT